MNHLWLRTLLFNTPLLMQGEYLHEVLNLFSERLNITNINNFTDGNYAVSAQQPHKQLMHIQSMDGELTETEEVETSAGNAFAIVPILGSLVQRGGQLQSDSTVLRGYDGIKSQVMSAAKSDGVGGVMLRVDSPGGVHHGCSETSEFIRQLSTELGFPVWASIEGSSMSAAYNLTTSAGRINAQPSSYAGSIGAFIAHTSIAEALDRQGIDVTVIKSCSKKAAGIPSEKLSAETIAEVQQKVNAARDQFIGTVEAHREGITRRHILSQEAGWFTAQDAQSEGLIDSIGSSDDFYQEFYEHINSSTAFPVAAAGNITETEMSKGVKTDTPTDQSVISAEDLAAAKSEAAETGRQEAAQRYADIYAHENHAVDAEFTAELAADMSLSVERVHSMLDRMKKPQASAAPDALPEKVTDEQLSTRFGPLDGVSAQEKSILQKVYRRNPGPDVKLDNFDPMDPDEPQNAKPKQSAEDNLTPFQKMQLRLDKDYGVTENGGNSDAA